MAVTRRQRRQIGISLDAIRRLQSSSNPTPPTRPSRDRNTSSSADPCHRSRPADGARKGVEVVAYKRRKPKKY